MDQQQKIKMSRSIPTNIVIEMNRRGFPYFDIIRYLKGKGYTPVEIGDAFNQARIKLELAKNASEEFEEKADGVSEEKHPNYLGKIDEEINKKKPETITALADFQIKQFIELINSKIKGIEEKNKKQEQALEVIKEEIPRIIQQQSSSIKMLNAEVQALQQTFSKVLEPLAHNIKLISGVLDLSKEEKSSEKVEKEIKKEEQDFKKIKLKEKKEIKPRKKTEKIIKKTVTVTEIQEKPAKKSKKKDGPSLDDVF